MPIRPKSLKEVAEKASTLEAWGYALAEFLDEVNAARRAGSSASLFDLVREEPPVLRVRFPEGETADAFGAALAEYLSEEAGVPAPSWTREHQRILSHAWFPLPQFADQPHLRSLIERETPPAFRAHNVFIDENSLVRV